MADDTATREALAEADAALERRNKRRDYDGKVRWSDLDRELARHALAAITGKGDRLR